MIGLNSIEIDKINKVFSKFHSIHSVTVYGSRAKGTHTISSDIDLSLKGEDINLETLNKLSVALDDLLLPYQFDLTIFDNIQNKELLDHILRVGHLLYEKSN